MKTVSQLGSDKKPVGTTAYFLRVEHLMQCSSSARKGYYSIMFIKKMFLSFPSFHGYLHVHIYVPYKYWLGGTFGFLGN